MFSMTAEVPDRAQTQVNPWIVTIAVMLGTFMEILDTTVVNVSIPLENLRSTAEQPLAAEGEWEPVPELVGP